MDKTYKLAIVFLLIALVFTAVAFAINQSREGRAQTVSAPKMLDEGGNLKLVIEPPMVPAPETETSG